MALSRLFLAALFLALTAFVANAYTIVLRNGRRIEIPDKFTVTKSTLTYEVDSGIQITIQLAGVDVAATERANGQPTGSFWLRASAPPKVIESTVQKRASADRSITNKDLEPFRRTRIQSELAYEKRRKELGLPSSADWRKESAEIQERTRQQLLNTRAREQDAEEYWRNRASPLRSEIATTEAQVDYVRHRLDELPPANSFGAFSTAIPFGTVGAPILGFPFQTGLANTGINTGLVQARSLFPNQPGRFQRFHGGRGRFAPFRGGNLLAIPFQSFDSSYERTELVTQLNELQMRLAGLQARWRDLGDEARRAGAYPGWLRP